MKRIYEKKRLHRAACSAGFSLIELLIVVAIILIIAAIAIPSYMHSKMAANESSAAESLRTIVTAEITYSNTYGTGFAPLVNLGGASPCVTAPPTACLLDSQVSSGVKSGYNLATPIPGGLGTAVAPNPSFVANAVPIAPGQSGQTSFCADESAVVRKDPTGATVAATVAACEALNPL